MNNYKQALDIQDGSEALATSMAEVGIEDVSEFHSRLKEEMVYLKGLSKEPEEETEQIQYFKGLVTLMERK